MKTTIQKWGNSFGVRLPMKLINEKGIFDGTPVEISEEKEKIIIRYFPEKKKKTLKSLINRIKPENLHHEIDYGEAQGNEIW